MPFFPSWFILEKNINSNFNISKKLSIAITFTFSLLFLIGNKESIAQMSKTAKHFQILMGPFVSLGNSSPNYRLISKVTAETWSREGCWIRKTVDIFPTEAGSAGERTLNFSLIFRAGVINKSKMYNLILSIQITFFSS